MSAVCLVVLGMKKGHGLPFTAIRVLSSYLLRGEDPTPLLSLPQPIRVLSDRSEKSTPYAHSFISFSHSATVDLFCFCVSVVDRRQLSQ